MALAATFDTRAARTHSRVVAREAKFKGNDFVFAPTVNIMRTPLGGRGLVGNVKHYPANNQEGQVLEPGSNRFFVDAKIDERTVREIYLPHFEAAVREADVAR